MKPATRAAIVIGCLLIVAALLYPPWVDSYSKEFVGFHFITGKDVNNAYRSQIDYAKLAIIILCLGAVVVATYFIATSNFASGAASSIKRMLQPLASLWGWLEKHWLWIALAVALIKVVVHLSTRNHY